MRWNLKLSGPVLHAVVNDVGKIIDMRESLEARGPQQRGVRDGGAAASQGEPAAVIEVGRCACCCRMAQITDWICGRCSDALGGNSRLARLAHRCRTDPEFHRKVFDRLDDPARRAQLVRLFGPPVPRVRLEMLDGGKP